MSSTSTVEANRGDDDDIQVIPDPSNPAGIPPSSRRRRFGRWCLAHPAITALLVAAFVRLSFAIGIYVINGGALFGDETTYTGIAWSKAEGTTSWWDPFISRLYWGTSTFTLPMTWLFKLWGEPVTLLGQLIAVTYATLAAFFTGVVAKRVVRPSLALAAGFVVALLPSQVLFSVLVLKDSAAWFCAAGLAYIVVRLSGATGRALVLWVGAAGVMLFLLGHVREHSTVVATWALLVAACIPAAQRLLRIGLVGIVVLAVPIMVGVGPLGTTLILHHGDLDERRADNAEGANTAFVPDATVRDLQVATNDRVEAETEVAQAEHAVVAPPTTIYDSEPERKAEAARLLAEAQARLEAARAQLQLALQNEQKAQQRVEKSPASNLGDLFGGGGGSTSSTLSALPIGLRVMILDPLPWEATSNSRVRLAMTEMVLWYPLLLLAAIGLVAGRRRLAYLAFPILVIGGTFLMYALSEGNFGTAFRHRGETVWAVGIMAAVGAEALLRRRRGESPVLPAL